MRVLGLVLLALAVSGCVEPTLGPTQVAARAAGGDFQVEVISPSSVPAPTRVQGALESIDRGPVTVLVGWAPSEQATLLVVVEGDAEVLDVRRLVRDDAAAALGDATHAGLGFRLVVRSRAGAVERACVLARLPQGDVTVLAGSDETWCPAP